MTYFLNFLLEIWVTVLLLFLLRKYIKEGIIYLITIYFCSCLEQFGDLLSFFSSRSIFIFCYLCSSCKEHSISGDLSFYDVLGVMFVLLVKLIPSPGTLAFVMFLVLCMFCL